MREIKFRIYNKKTKKMVSVWSVAGARNLINDKPSYYFINNMHEKKSELMQFTGLKDKKGKEIYEGDIVKFDDGEIVEVVLFCGAFMPKLEKGQCVKINYDAKPVWQDGEVIGNIYENKELLK